MFFNSRTFKMFSVYAHRVAAVKDEENGAVKKVTDSVENYNSENRFGTL